MQLCKFRAPAHVCLRVQVTVDRPDVAGRVEILKVHSRGKSLSKDVDLDKVARRTPGFTGEAMRGGRPGDECDLRQATWAGSRQVSLTAATAV